MARGSLNISVAVLQTLLDQEQIQNEKYQKYFEEYQQLSRMLSGLINSQKQEISIVGMLSM